MPFVGTNTLKVGAMVEPLTAQMADYLGVPGGIIVKGVARKSEAAAAGIQARDVILKVGNDPISTTADWDRALRANQGKPVQVTILRDRKQQIINLQVDSKHKSEVDYQDLFPGLLPDGPCPLVGQLDPAWGADAAAAAETFRQQMEQFRQNFNPDDFKIDPNQMDELKKQMEQFRQNFKVEEFKINPKDMEQFGKEMEQLRHKFDQKQCDEMKRQMEQFQQQMQDMNLGFSQKV